MTPIELLNLSNSGNGRALIGAIAGQWAMGIGGDVGLHYLTPLSKKISLGTGVSLTDLGGTKFPNGGETQASNLSAGVAAKFQISPQADLKLAYDFTNMTDVDDWRKKSHFGLELKLPMLELWGGFNQVYLSFGGSFNLWIAKISVATYGTELGTLIRQNDDRRYSLRFDFKFDI